MLDISSQFDEFLHTKGIKAKTKLVIENIKKGVSESNAKNKERIGKARRGETPTSPHVSGKTIENEFNQFLKAKGLDGKYEVKVEDK